MNTAALSSVGSRMAWRPILAAIVDKPSSNSSGSLLAAGQTKRPVRYLDRLAGARRSSCTPYTGTPARPRLRMAPSTPWCSGEWASLIIRTGASRSSWGSSFGLAAIKAADPGLRPQEICSGIPLSNLVCPLRVAYIKWLADGRPKRGGHVADRRFVLCIT